MFNPNNLLSKVIIQDNNLKEEPKNEGALPNVLKIMYDVDTTIIEIGIDEAGRGPMFGRVYAGIVVLPKDNSFNHSQMKDSKKFHSKKKIEQVADYIKRMQLLGQ